MEATISRPSPTQKYILATHYQAFCARKWARVRALGVACYLGFAPVLWMTGIERRKDEFLQHHYRHSLAVSLLFFFILAATAITDALGYVYATMLWNPGPDDLDVMQWLVRLFDYTGNFIVFVWAVTWMICIIGAWRGRMTHIPILSNLTQHKGWMDFSLVWMLLVRIAFVVLILIAAHGSLLAAHPGPSPQVYILYTTGGYIPTEQLWASYTPPQWTISLFFYPIIAAATSHWGKGSVIIEPLSDITFKQAVQNGHFVFVASHGGMEAGSFSYAFNPYQGFAPSDLQPGDAGSQLRYVYFAACFAGYRESDWKQALAPANVQTYARISYVEEHFFWVWLKGVEVIRGME